MPMKISNLDSVNHIAQENRIVDLCYEQLAKSQQSQIRVAVYHGEQSRSEFIAFSYAIIKDALLAQKKANDEALAALGVEIEK
jgi:hypothetical protein